MNKAIGSIIILVFILGAGIAFFQNVLVKPEAEVPTITTGGTSTSTTPNGSVATTTPVTVVGKCFVGGCSGQICSDQEGMVSTCEFREEYSCYKTAKCERQANGQCGWTDTPALRMCLQSAQ